MLARASVRLNSRAISPVALGPAGPPSPAATWDFQNEYQSKQPTSRTTEANFRNEAIETNTKPNYEPNRNYEPNYEPNRKQRTYL